MGADQMLQRMVDEGHEELEKSWQGEFEAMRDEIIATPGARDLVRTLKERGAVTVYATSGQPQDVEALRAVIGADDWIDLTVSSDEVEASKPAPDIFELALERASVQPEDAFVVGDTVWDIEAAHACGLPCIAVTTGGISEDELRSAGAAAVYTSPRELLEGLDQSPIAELLSPAR
jgi:HAD superfamily hydrolase (TIGR01549 family)